MSKIVLVEDDIHANGALTATLKVLGHETYSAHDAIEGDDRVRETVPSVVITDMMLPGKTGLDWIADLAARRPRTYLCLASGMADYRLLKRAMDSGAWSVLCKPFSVPDLVTMLKAADQLLGAAVQAERLGLRSEDSELALTCITSASIERIMAEAGSYLLLHGADADTALRRAPIAIHELLKNAKQHGGGSVLLTCRMDQQIQVQVSDEGQGFAWQKELSRRRMHWDGCLASGMQLISAVADEYRYEDRGRTACVTMFKTSPLAKGNAVSSTAIA